MRKSALIIANWTYEDPVLRSLVAPSQDAEAVADVLRDAAIGGFDVQVLTNAPSYKVCEETEAFFGDRERDDLLLYYFSGHGVTDDDGALYYAASNTLCRRLRSTAVSASFVNDIMNGCRSRRQVLLLDCCHAGAFAHAKAATGAVNVAKYFPGSTLEAGRGKFILTASDAFQYSFEGDAVEGKGVSSVFTEAVVEGLRSGAADVDGDGLITLDELYSFVYTRVRQRTTHQTPRKWASDVEGDVVIAANPRPTAAVLPEDLQAAIESFLPEARERAVVRLDRLLRGKHRGLSLAAQNALVALAAEDSRRVSAAAENCLNAWNQERASAVAEPPAPAGGQSDERERLAQQRAEALRIQREADEKEAGEKAAEEAAARARAEQLAAEVARRLAEQKAAQEKAALERAERDRAAAEEAEAVRIAKNNALSKRAQALRAERERIDAARAETERKAQEEAEIERARRQLGEEARKSKEARLRRERAEVERIDAAGTETERKAQEEAEIERARRQLGEEARKSKEARLRRERAEVERRERQSAEAERIERAEAEALQTEVERVPPRPASAASFSGSRSIMPGTSWAPRNDTEPGHPSDDQHREGAAGPDLFPGLGAERSGGTGASSGRRLIIAVVAITSVFGLWWIGSLVFSHRTATPKPVPEQTTAVSAPTSDTPTQPQQQPVSETKKPVEAQPQNTTPAEHRLEPEKMATASKDLKSYIGAKRAAADAPVKVSAGVMQVMLLAKTEPFYPPIAKAAGVSGMVVLQANISKEGTVTSLQAIRGPAMLQSAAIDAVKAWRYKPYVLNGEPVEVLTTVNVVFTLQDKAY